MILKFFGRVKKGRLSLWNKESLTNYIATLKDGDVELIIRPKSNLRSTELNNYFHGVVLHTISEYTGYTKDEVKQLMKEKFQQPDENGRYRSTSKYSTEEMIQFIEKIQIYWAGEGLIIPDPNSVDMESVNA